MFNRNKTGELIIRSRFSPRTKLLVVIGGVVVLTAAVTLIYNYGLSMAGFERYSASRAQDSLATEMKRLESENRELRESLARAQRAVQMSDSTHQELEKTLQSSSQEIVKLREELNFYRNIISPADKKSGLRIQSLVIEPDGTNRFRYKLVLIQALKHERTVYGNASIVVNGLQAGQTIHLRIPSTGDRAMNVNLKYFQEFEGRFELPGNFRPQTIKVLVTTTNGPPIEETLNWPLS